VYPVARSLHGPAARNSGRVHPYNPPVARFSDWIDLWKSTFASLRSSDVTSLYALEWPETKKRLIAEHRGAIDGERRRFRRWIRTGSAILYGLVKRLAPPRRLLFFISFIVFFACLGGIVSRNSGQFSTYVELVLAFLVMVLLLAMELIDKLKFRDELQLARDLQASLIPQKMPESREWDVAAFNWIANTVGGDIYDFVPLADGRIAVLFGDASGHGMAAGLVMAVAHASFRTQLDVDPSPQSIMASLNRILCRTGGSRSFFTCCYVLLSPDGSYVATIAGHPPIFHLDAAGNAAERIGHGAYPLGVKLGLSWEVVSGTVAPGEKLLLHSDGLTESRNAAEQDLGDAHIEIVARRMPGCGAARLVDGIVAEWRRFMGSIPAEDDVSLAVIARR
jgi:hypothetical protein